MNKKVYQQLAMRVVKIQHSQMLCVSGDPVTHNEYSSNASYSRENRGWDDDWEE